MMAVSILSSVMYSIKTILVQTDNVSRQIDDVLEGKKSEFLVNEEYHFYRKQGLNEIIERCRLELFTDEVVDSNIVNVRHTNIHYIPSVKENVLPAKDDEIGAYEKLVKRLSTSNDLYFWDLLNGKSKVSDVVMENSDVIVVNIPQENVVNMIMDDDRKKKCVYVIGKYDDASKYGLFHYYKNLGVPKDSIGVIPYNVRFHDAINEGKLIPFITKNALAKKHEANYEFVNSLYKTTNMILKKAGVIGIGE